MQPCEVRSDGGLCIIDHQTHIHLTSDEASAFRGWWSTRQQTWRAPHQHTQPEMRLAQNDLNHGDQGKTALPDLHEPELVVRGLQEGGQTMTQRALQLLKAYQSEVHVHPLLEEATTFAQG